MHVSQVDIFVDYANCGNDITIPVQSAFPSLDVNVSILSSVLVWLRIQYLAQVYATIVGDCASAEGGCPVTQQNFIDLVYSELTATGKNVFPTSADVLVSDRIAPIFAWAGFTAAEGVPYLNFNDYLHFFRSQ
jgi:hypothetical protein